MSTHGVQFYESDAFLVDSLADMVGKGLDGGEGVVVIATESHLDALDKRLAQRGIETQKARDEDRYLLLDAADTLGRFARDGRLDEAAFAQVVGGALERASGASRKRVHAFGEMVALLWARRQPALALELETLWNELARVYPLAILCGYPLAVFDDRHADALKVVCAAHDHVIPAESFSALPTANDRDLAVAELQRQARALEVEVAERRRTERVLLERNHTQHALIEASPLPIVMIDRDAAVRLWNPAAERVFGWSEAEVIGRPIPIVPPDKLEECGWIRADVQRGDSFYSVATQRVRRDGSVLDVLVSAAPVVDDDGTASAIVLMFEDVTARNRVEAERSAALRDSEAANRAKDEFLAMLGHELRNPLSSLRNAVLTASFDPGKRDRAMQIARRGTDQLVRLVDDLLDVARITRGRILLRRSRVSIRSIVESALESTRRLVEDHGHRLVAILPDATLQVDGDTTRLEQVLVNLIANAAKFTESGGHIEVSAHHEGGEAVIRVRDDGIGIASEMLPRIFDLFAQAERGLDRAVGGLGVGLTVVRRLIELHGGRVEASSDGPGKGTTIEVRLPAVIEPQVMRPDEPIEFAGARGANVLVVEDNFDAADSLAMLIAAFGHRASVVYDGARALEIVGEESFDLVLMDIGLPGMDGYEVARLMRETEGLRGVCLVALTGYGRDEEKQRAFDSGFDRHLVKPVDPRVLRDLLASASSRQSVAVGD